MDTENKSSSYGIVYILTNPCLDGWVKIGMTAKNEIKRRLKELNTPTNIPLSFRCYATYEVSAPRLVEQKVHSLIDRIDASLHAKEKLENGKIREREFFRISPETAFGIFRDVAELRGDIECLKLFEPTAEDITEEHIAESRKIKRTNSSFAMLNITLGTELHFMLDQTIIARTVDVKNSLEYNGERYSVSNLAKKLLQKTQGWSENISINGWKYFGINGVDLYYMRNQMEETDDDTTEE